MTQSETHRDVSPDARMRDIQQSLHLLVQLVLGNHGAPVNFGGYNSASTYPFKVKNQSNNASAPAINILDNADAIIIQGTKAAVTIGKAATASSTLNVVGNFSVNTDKFTVVASSGATHVLGDFDVNTDKFTVAASSGNVAFPGNLAINTNKFTVAGSSGNTVIAGTLNANGAVTLGDASGDVITITGTATFAEDVTMSKGLIVDTTTLVVDEVNNKVGIGFTPASTSAMVTVAGTGLFTDLVAPTTGTGVALSYSAAIPAGIISAFDFSGAGTFKDLRIQGDTITLRPGGTNAILVDTTGIRFFNAGTGVAKQTVSGTRTGTLGQLQTVVQNLLAALDNYDLINDTTS